MSGVLDGVLAQWSCHSGHAIVIAPGLMASFLLAACESSTEIEIENACEWAQFEYKLYCTIRGHKARGLADQTNEYEWVATGQLVCMYSFSKWEKDGTPRMAQLVNTSSTHNCKMAQWHATSDNIKILTIAEHKLVSQLIYLQTHYHSRQTYLGLEKWHAVAITASLRHLDRATKPS